MSKSERVEGQKSLHTEGGPTGYLCSATYRNISSAQSNEKEQ